MKSRGAGQACQPHFERERQLVNSAGRFTHEPTTYSVEVSGYWRFDDQSNYTGDRVWRSLHLALKPGLRPELDKREGAGARGTANVLPGLLISATMGLTFEGVENAESGACAARKLCSSTGRGWIYCPHLDPNRENKAKVKGID